MVSGKITF